MDTAGLKLKEEIKCAEEIENLLVSSFDTDWKDGVIDDETTYDFTLYRVNSNKKKLQTACTTINADKDLLIATFRYYYSLLENLPQSYMVEVYRNDCKGMNWFKIPYLVFARKKVIKYRRKYDKH